LFGGTIACVADLRRGLDDFSLTRGRRCDRVTLNKKIKVLPS